MNQLGFDDLLATAEADNLNRQLERACAHLPDTMEAALPFYRALIESHHAAMLAGDIKAVHELRNEAHDLALKLNGFDGGILAHPEAPGYVLDRETCAAEGAVPLWGQSGSFVIACDSMQVRIEAEGLFGIGARFMPWPGFAAHAVEWDRPFLSETGYRSFLGITGELRPGFTFDRFAAETVTAHVRRELKGKLVTIAPQYRNS